jgi:hypothetical protein
MEMSSDVAETLNMRMQSESEYFEDNNKVNTIFLFFYTSVWLFDRSQ